MRLSTLIRGVHMRATRPSSNKFGAEVFIYGALSDLPLAPELALYVRGQQVCFLYAIGYEFLHHGLNRRDAMAALWRALKLQPSARLLVAWGLAFMPAALRHNVIRTWQRTLPLRSSLKTPWPH